MLGIVLSKQGIRERDQIISMFGVDTGKISLLARGMKKLTSRNAGAAEPYTFVNFDWVPGKEYAYLTNIIPIIPFSDIRSTYEKSMMAGIVVAILDRFLEERDVDRMIFKLLREFLQTLEQVEETNIALVDSFVMKLLRIHGIAPELTASVLGGMSHLSMKQAMLMDGRKWELGLSFDHGGIVSPREAQALRREGRVVHVITSEDIDMLEVLGRVTFSVLSDFVRDGYARGAHEMLYLWYRYMVARSIPDWQQFFSEKIQEAPARRRQ